MVQMIPSYPFLPFCDNFLHVGGFDDGDCIEFNEKYPDCESPMPHWVGNVRIGQVIHKCLSAMCIISFLIESIELFPMHHNNTGLVCMPSRK